MKTKFKSLLKNLGFLHFFFQRFSAIFLIFLFLNIFFSNSVFINTAIIIIILFHLKFGYNSLIEDYIHKKYIKLIGTISLNLIFVYLLKALFLFVLLL
jgi:succinate dehydrogenase hydrophobic anchor subunit